MKILTTSGLSRFLNKFGLKLYTKEINNPFNSTAQKLAVNYFKVFGFKIIWIEATINNVAQSGNINYDEAFIANPVIIGYNAVDSAGSGKQPSMYLQSISTYFHFALSPISGAGDLLVMNFLIVGRTA